MQQLFFTQPLNVASKKTIFNEERQIVEIEAKEEQDDKNDEHTLILSQKKYQVKKQLRQLLNNKQNIYLKENLASLKKRKILEGFSGETPAPVQQCFSFFSQALQNARSLRSLDISGMDIHPLLAIEIGQGLQHNASLREINISGCKMNSFCLQYIFSSITNHKTLQSINLYNNQGFTIDLMNDISQFVFKGKNHLKKLKLTHCNISNTAMSYLLRNLKYSETINAIDISMMQFNTEVLTSLGIALQHYKGDKVLEYLNVSDTNIKNEGLDTLAQRVSWNMRKINLKELVLRRNFITQTGIPQLEAFLRKISQLQKLDLSNNKIEEFTCQDLLQRKMYEINLSNNVIMCFPPQFFMNTLVVNLSNNNISSQGAFQLSSILRQNPLWVELNLSNNQLKSEGFNSLIFGLRDNRMLKKLIVAKNQLDGEAIICYMINHEQVYFEHLDISFNQIRHAIIFVLLKFIKSGCLRCLRCSYLEKEEEIRKVDQNVDQNAKFIKQDEHQQKSNNAAFQLTSFNLRELDFHGNKEIFTPVVASLSTYYNKIEKLDLSSCAPITDQDIELLCLFLRKSTIIHDLNLRDLSLGTMKKDCIKKLSEALFNSSIKYLNLSKNRMYKQIKRLFNSNNLGSNYKLEVLDLSYNYLEAKHAPYIEKMLMSLKNLQEVNFSRNCINFEGLAAINRSLFSNRTLKRLNLSYQKLSADDLLILSQTLGNESLQELNLANNPYTTKLKTFFYQCSTQKQEFLHLSQVYFDNANYHSLMTIIENQKRNLFGVNLDSCIFQNKDFCKFFEHLSKSRKLTYFAINYNPTIYKDLEGTVSLISKLKNLRILKLNQVSLADGFVNALQDWFSKIGCCNLSTLDLSQNKLQQQWLNSLCLGISNNSSLRNFMLNDCNLGFLNLTPLGIAVSQNKTLEVLEIAKNQIKNNLDNFLTSALENAQTCRLEELNLAENPLDKQSILDLFIPRILNNMNGKNIKLRYLNLANCHLQIDLFKDILQGQQLYKDNYSFQHILSLSLSNNQLGDNVGQQLKQIIQSSTKMKELYLQNNLFTSNGMILIFEGMFANQTIRTINISSNKLDDIWVLKLYEQIQNKELSNLEFIMLRDNNFTRIGLKKLAQIIFKIRNLFIDNIWSELDDSDADIILQQYTRIGQTYKLEQSAIPQFLKEIQIQRSNLTDKFCEVLGKYYPMLGFIEFIDISDNPFITMYGKVYLFFHLFDTSYERHQLKAMYITDSQETRKLFDDGLLRYLTLRFRNFLYPPTEVNVIKKQNSKAEVFGVPNNQLDSQMGGVQQIIGGMCGSWLIHKINKLMAYLDQIEPPQFIVSTLFIGKFRRNNINIKIIVMFFWITFLAINLLQFLQILSSEQKPLDTILIDYNQTCPDDVKDQTEECNKFGYSNFVSDVYYFIIVFASTIAIEIAQIIVTVTLRRKIQPAFQIVHPSLLKYLHSQFPHQKELFLMLFSILSKIGTFPERIFLSYLLVLTDDGLDYEPVYFKFQVYKFILGIIILLRYGETLIISIINLIKFMMATPRKDQAFYLSLLQRNFHYQSYYVLSDILVSLCPVQGYQLTKAIKINYEIIVETYRILTIELFLIIFISFFSREFNNIKQLKFDNTDPYWFLSGWIILTLIKAIVTIISSLFTILTVRPAVVKQHGFNQALDIKKFYENKSEFVRPSNIKIEYHLQCFADIEKEKQAEKMGTQYVLDNSTNLQNNSQNLENEIKFEMQKSKMDEIQEDVKLEAIDEEDSLNDDPNKVMKDSEYSYSQIDYQDPPQYPLRQERPKFKYINHLISLLNDNNRDYQQLTEYFLDFQIIKDFQETQGAQFFNRLIQNIAYKVFMPQEYIIEAGKSVNSLYIFFSGMIIRNSTKKDKNYIEITEKQILGEEFFLSRQQSKYNYIAHKESLICYIHQDDFYKFVKKRKLKKSLINNILSFSQFQDMSPNFIEQIIQRSNTLNYFNRQIVFDIGDEPQSWFIILDGDFQIYYKYNQQYQPLIILSRGNYFGELEIIKKQKRSYRVCCISTHSEILEIPKVQFYFLLQKNLSFNSMINENVNNRIQKYASMIIQNKQNLEFQFSSSPQKPKFAFNSPHVRIRSKNLVDNEDIKELYLQRKKELTNLLNYRIQLTEYESSQSITEKLNQRNPRLRQFLDRLNKGRFKSNIKQKEQRAFQLDFHKSHHKIKTEIALSSRDTLGAIKSTLYSPTTSSRAQTNYNNQSPKIYNIFFKLQTNTKNLCTLNPENLETEI
ncbi:unnamed protein product [Paramecium pentaurelia]|uniref:Cyclic nucleotide-binding domain-containing protein n=1 Tax=Paramecium pentaurelia TaxID=43138 RepID=A0A8S1T1S1_9CILI|nr:unnamed protein product [Paramecium pentaurelia]